MVKGILGRKVGMTQLYDDAGQAIPVTVIQAGPCHVLQVRSLERDGYTAVQLGYLDKKRPHGRRRIRPSQASRAERGHVASIPSARSRRLREAGVALRPKAECEPKRFIRELRGDVSGYQVGQVITVDIFQGVAAVDVTGTSKGRGYAGVIKRHGFAGLRASHGTKKVHRQMGTTGGLAAWRGGGRPKKGKRMPGHYGNQRVTVRNLQVVRIDPVNHLLVVRGAVPGPNGGFVVVRQTNKVG
jgi:large subunit ribosomal protein L3